MSVGAGSLEGGDTAEPSGQFVLSAEAGVVGNGQSVEVSLLADVISGPGEVQSDALVCPCDGIVDGIVSVGEPGVAAMARG